jgi:hypothetical protein
MKPARLALLIAVALTFEKYIGAGSSGLRKVRPLDCAAIPSFANAAPLSVS